MPLQLASAMHWVKPAPDHAKRSNADPIPAMKDAFPLETDDIHPCSALYSMYKELSELYKSKLGPATLFQCEDAREGTVMLLQIIPRRGTTTRSIRCAIQGREAGRDQVTVALVVLHRQGGLDATSSMTDMPAS